MVEDGTKDSGFVRVLYGVLMLVLQFIKLQFILGVFLCMIMIIISLIMLYAAYKTKCTAPSPGGTTSGFINYNKYY